jgi:hypothetical protein
MSIGVPEEIYLVEKRDEDQIIKSMRGEIVNEWVYSFVQNGRKITALSYAGVKEAVRQRGNISWYPCEHCHQPVHIEETPDEIRAVVTAWDLERNVKFLGASAASKKQPFAWVLAVNKAERNALRKFLPEKQITLLIEEYLRRQNPNPVSVPSGKLG